MNAIKIIKNNFIWFVLLVFFVVFSLHSLLRYWNYNTFSWDLGLYVQQVWLYSHTFSFYNTVRGTNLLSDHFGLILYLFAPIYRLFPRAETLLIIQALLVVLSGYPIYKIAEDKLKNRFIAIVLLVAYLSSTGIRSSIDFDFHLATIAVFFYAIFLYFWLEKKYFWSIIFAILAILTKEDMPLYIACAGLGLALINFKNKEEAKKALLLAFLSLLSFAAIYKIISVIPTTGANINYFSFNYLGANYREVVENLIYHPLLTIRTIWENFINNPMKINTFKTYYFGFWYLPLLSPEIIIFSIPFLLVKFVTDRDVQILLSGQYAVTGMFILTLAVIFFLYHFAKWFLKKWAKIVLNCFALVFLLFTFHYNIISNSQFWNVADRQGWQNIKNYAGLNKMVRLIPESASVATQDPIVSHLANREKIYLLQCPFCNTPGNRIYDYVLLDTRYGSAFAPKELADIKPVINEMSQKGTLEGWGNYTLVAKDEEKDCATYLFKNNPK